VDIQFLPTTFADLVPAAQALRITRILWQTAQAKEKLHEFTESEMTNHLYIEETST
jgi:hypothetical protein